MFFVKTTTRSTQNYSSEPHKKHSLVVVKKQYRNKQKTVQ
jgi:hypothetical protein